MGSSSLDRLRRARERFAPPAAAPAKPSRVPAKSEPTETDRWNALILQRRGPMSRILDDTPRDEPESVRVNKNKTYLRGLSPWR